MTRLLPALALATAFLAGCASSPIERAGTDVEIARDITVELSKDPRFSDVRVTCKDHVVTLKGRVDDKNAASDAFQIARGQARGATVLPRLLIRAK